MPINKQLAGFAIQEFVETNVPGEPIDHATNVLPYLIVARKKLTSMIYQTRVDPGECTAHYARCIAYHIKRSLYGIRPISISIQNGTCDDPDRGAVARFTHRLDDAFVTTVGRKIYDAIVAYESQ